MTDCFIISRFVTCIGRNTQTTNHQGEIYRRLSLFMRRAFTISLIVWIFGLIIALLLVTNLVIWSLLDGMLIFLISLILLYFFFPLLLSLFCCPLVKDSQNVFSIFLYSTLLRGIDSAFQNSTIAFAFFAYLYYFFGITF